MLEQYYLLRSDNAPAGFKITHYYLDLTYPTCTGIVPRLTDSKEITVPGTRSDLATKWITNHNTGSVALHILEHEFFDRSDPGR
jgi:hypothetical protein